jgi:MFS family permease
VAHHHRPRRPQTGPSALAELLWPGTFLWYGMAACTLFLYAIAVLAPWLTTEFGLSRLQLGAIPTVVFSFGAVTSLLTGHLVDRHGPRRAMGWLFALNAAAFLALALARSSVWLFTAALLGGVGTALGNPATNQIISTTVTHARRGLLVGVKQSGVPSAGVLAGAAMPPIAMVSGWRAAAAAGFVFTAAGSVAALQLPPSQAKVRHSEDSAPAGHPVWSRSVLSLTAYVFLIGSGISAVQTYVVLYGVEAVGLHETAAGWGAALLGALGIVSRVAAAPLAQRVRHPRVPLIVVAAGSAISTLLLALGPASPGLFFVGAAGIGLTALAGNSVAHLAIVTRLPTAVAGRSSGGVQTGYYAGFILFPLIFGATVDVTGSYSLGWILVGGWFLGAVLLAAIAFRSDEVGSSADPPGTG